MDCSWRAWAYALRRSISMRSAVSFPGPIKLTLLIAFGIVLSRWRGSGLPCRRRSYPEQPLQHGVIAAHLLIELVLLVRTSSLSSPQQVRPRPHRCELRILNLRPGA